MIGAWIHRFRLSSLVGLQSTRDLFRYASMNTTASSTTGEKKLNEILKKRFPNARMIDVKDTSCNYRMNPFNLIKNLLSFLFLAGCGASYEIIVVSEEFEKMRTVNQHRLVSEALSQQLPNIHAIRIFTGTDEKQFVNS